MHDRLRRDEQHGEGGDGEGAESERRPVEHDADQHDGDHDEGALGRDAGARQHQIERGGDSAPAAAHFLIGRRLASDGISASKARRKKKAMPATTAMW